MITERFAMENEKHQACAEDSSIEDASAQPVFEQAEEIRLTGASAELVASLLTDPPAVAPALARAFRHHERLIGKL
jgi:uncharacterized protein (DUF1778 family)